MTTRYDRQAPLVNQQRLADLTVTVVGTGQPLPFVLQNLAMLGVGAGTGQIAVAVPDRDVASTDIIGQHLLDSKDVGSPLDESLIYRLEILNPEVRAIVDSGPAGPTPDLTIWVPNHDELSCPPPSAEDRLVVAQVGEDGFHVGPEPVRAASFEHNLLTVSLASAAGALAAQEVVRGSGALFAEPQVRKSWATAQHVLAADGLGISTRQVSDLDGNPHPGLHAVLAKVWPEVDPDALPLFRSPTGIALDAVVLDVLGDDEIVVQVEMPDNELSRAVWQSARFTRPSLGPQPPVSTSWSPFAGDVIVDGEFRAASLPLDGELTDGRVIVIGVGALGSWVTSLLAVSPVTDMVMTLVDMDNSVERHNLNRQVLYTEASLGRPKVAAAAERLTALNPTLSLQIVRSELGPTVLKNSASADGPQYSDWLEAAGEELESDQIAAVLSGEFIAAEIARSQVVVSAPDNPRTRWLLNVMSERAGTPMINAAVDGFVGRVHRVDSLRSDPCLVCRIDETIKHDAVRRSCQEITGDVPIASIGTGSAVVASLQTALVIASLRATSDDEFCNIIAWDGQDQVLLSLCSGPRWSDECPAHLDSSLSISDPEAAGGT